MFKYITKNDFIDMKGDIIDFGVPTISKGCKVELDEHLIMIKKEFSGKKRILYYHSWLIVHIRRKIDLKKNIESFFILWEEEKEFLIKYLSLRWLVSACDTIIDYSDNHLEISNAISVLLFINTIKLYETEELMMFDEYNISYSTNKPEEVIPLFDGLTTFMIGQGDMIKNMITRLKNIKTDNIISSYILQEVIERVHITGSVYKRMANNHKANETRWWQDEQFFIKKS